MPKRLAAILLPCCLSALTGCLPSQQSPAQPDFRAADTSGRVPALVGAADRDDADTLFELVHALSDKDPAVRLFAIQSLEARTGQTLGYRYYESIDRRRDAVTRWRDWLMKSMAPASTHATEKPAQREDPSDDQQEGPTVEPAAKETEHDQPDH